jgi:hypothetical protein
MYLVNVIGALAPDLDGLTVLSAFRYFDLKPLISEGTYPVVDSVVLWTAGVIGWIAALLVFRLRDLAA